MRIVVASCDAYRDVWPAFFQLFEKFWPNREYFTDLLVDHWSDASAVPSGVALMSFGGNWCQRLAQRAASCPEDEILLLQEDFLLTAPVNVVLIEEALTLLEDNPKLGAIRIYPCPGARPGFGEFGYIERSEAYRTSLQATIWRTGYLHAIAEHSPSGSASDFEIEGGAYAATLPQEVMAFREGRLPRPLEYLCTGVVRGKFLPDVKKLCEENGIEMDYSRGFL